MSDDTANAIFDGCLGCVGLVIGVWLCFMLAGITIIMWRAVYA